jgi:flavin-dependent dehydrogenase
MRADFDAVIIGAGPAGSTAAILLARAGWSVALVEKQAFPRRKVCGECIAASNLPLLQALGIGSALEASAGPELRRVAFMRAGGCVIADLPPGEDAKWCWGRAVSRETLDSLLLQQARAAGAQVLQPWVVQSLAGSPGHWFCNVRVAGLQEELILNARVAIDAHGSWEALPAGKSATRGPLRDSDLLAFKANFHDTSLTEGMLPVLSFNGGYGGMVLEAAGVSTLACCIRYDALSALRRAAPGLRAGEAVEAMLRRECKGVRIALSTATRNAPWLAAGPIAPGIRLRPDDEVLRIGNAAGEAHPILGEGISMALQSAWLLSAQLLSGAPGQSLHTRAWQRQVALAYAGQWRRQFAPRLRLAAVFAHAAMRPASGALLLALARQWPVLLTQGARWGGKTRSAADPSLMDAGPWRTPSTLITTEDMP